MRNTRPQSLISDGISLMQKGHLASAPAIFDRAAYDPEDGLCAQFLNAVCSILEANNIDLNELISDKELYDSGKSLKTSHLERAVETIDKALAKLRDELDNVEQSEYRPV